jgi:tRNA A-37 threonylcarbamoyl transferase component Bud32
MANEPKNGTLLVPNLGIERILNEAACMEFISFNTNIPVPKLYSCFEDDEAAYLVMEFVDGTRMDELSVEGRRLWRGRLRGLLG